MFSGRRQSLTGFLLASAILTTACSRQPEPLPPPTAAAPEDAPASMPASEPPAESGLAIKRGVVTADGDHALFRACDDPVDLWVIDAGEGALTQLLTEDTTSVYIEAYGERGPVPDDLAAAKGQAGAFTLEQLLYAAEGEGRNCSVPPPAYKLAARGNEPSWAAEVSDTGMIWKQPGEPREIVLNGVQSEDAEGAVGYRSSDAGHTFEVQIEAQPCRDSMSGEYFAFSSRAVFDGKEFTGCAHVGTQDAQ